MILGDLVARPPDLFGEAASGIFYMSAVIGYPSPLITAHPNTVEGAVRTFRSRAGSTAFTGRIVAQVKGFTDPYASPFEYDFITTDDEPGEVFAFGRPLRDCRFFPNKAIKKNVKLLKQFLTFANTEDTSEWRFWNIGLANRKATVGNLKEELKRFNKKLILISLIYERKNS